MEHYLDLSPVMQTPPLLNSAHEISNKKHGAWTGTILVVQP